MLNLFKKKEIKTYPDDAIISPADGQLIDITTVSDPVFAQKMIGDGIALQADGDVVTMVAPENGILTVMYPTGHAYGIQGNNGVEVLIHIGIETVQAKGDGFKVLKKQDEPVRAGDPIVRVDFGKLKKKYDTTVMIIISNPANHTIQFVTPSHVKQGDSLVQSITLATEEK